MNCSICGNEIREGHQYCVQCGAKAAQDGGLPPASTPEPYRQPASQAEQAPSADPETRQPVAEAPSVPGAENDTIPVVQAGKEPRKGPHPGIIAAATLGALGIAIVLAGVLSGGFPVTSEPAAEDITNPTGWVSYDSAECGFAVSLPGTPTKTESEEVVRGATMPCMLFECAADEGCYTAMVVDCDAEQVDVAADPRGVFYQYINGVAEDGGYSIEEWHNTGELSGHPCASAVYRNSADAEAFRLFVTSRGGRLYVLRGEKTSPTDFDFFTQSLSLYSPTGDAAAKNVGEPDGDMSNDVDAAADGNAGVNSDLETKSILSDKVEILVPKAFTIMSEEMASIKYPLGDKPTIIYTNESGSINVAFRLSDDELSSSKIPQMKDYIVQNFEESIPSAEWLDSGTEVIDKKTIGYVELITPAMNADIYNLIWFTDLDGETLMCTFNCTVEEMGEWKPIAQEIKDSFRVK